MALLPYSKIAQAAKELRSSLIREGFSAEEANALVLACMPDLVDEAKFGKEEYPA